MALLPGPQGSSCPAAEGRAAQSCCECFVEQLKLACDFYLLIYFLLSTCLLIPHLLLWCCARQWIVTISELCITQNSHFRCLKLVLGNIIIVLTMFNFNSSSWNMKIFYAGLSKDCFRLKELRIHFTAKCVLNLILPAYSNKVYNISGYDAWAIYVF